VELVADYSSLEDRHVERVAAIQGQLINLPRLDGAADLRRFDGSRGAAGDGDGFSHGADLEYDVDRGTHRRVYLDVGSVGIEPWRLHGDLVIADTEVNKQEEPGLVGVG